jgi:hypothetical protein
MGAFFTGDRVHEVECLENPTGFLLVGAFHLRLEPCSYQISA